MYVLTAQDLYKLLGRELPENVYPESGVPSDYRSTSELQAISVALETAYKSASAVWENEIVISALVEKINDWEQVYFATNSLELSFEDRLNRILAKIRSSEDISWWQIATTVATLLPEAIVQVRQRNNTNNPVTSALKGEQADLVWTGNWQSGDPFPTGVTGRNSIRFNQSEMREIQTEAFTYDVIIFAQGIVSQIKVDLIDATLTEQEPARCNHTVTIFPSAVFEAVNIGPVTQFNCPTDAIKLTSTGFVGYQIAYFGFVDDPWSKGFRDITNSDLTIGGIWTSRFA